MNLYISKTRDKDRYRSKDIRHTSIKTKLGVVEYSRRLYLDTYTGSRKEYGKELLLVGINYDKKTKKHECVIERAV